MLTSLSIKNFALMENVEVSFSGGLNVISGESGSGKSILAGALNALFGGRSGKECIRDGESRCEIEAFLQIPVELKAKVAAFIAEYDLEDNGDELCVRRVLSENSARSYVNGSSLPLKAIKDLAAMFFDFNRPDEELSLNSKERQLELLDRFGDIDLAPYRSAYHELTGLQKKLADFDREQPDEDALAESRELVIAMEKYDFQLDEEDELVKRHKILSNAREIITVSSRASQLLSGEENSVSEAFAALMREFLTLDKLADGTLEKLLDEAQNINGALNSLQNSLDIFASQLELDANALQEIEDRLDALYKLKRRFGPSVEELFEHYAQAQEQIRMSEQWAAYRSELLANISRAEELLKAESCKLSERRKGVAAELEKALLDELDALGFKKCRFAWQFDTAGYSLSGADDLDILFCANSGEKVLPLRRIASSGERSRLFLAIKNVLARVDDIPVVIFDEIDANIGGEIARCVGQALHELGKYRQIITISHLAQIACMADNHLKVAKYVREDGRTVSEVNTLNDDGRITELGRMLGNGVGAVEYARNIYLKR